MKYNQEAHKQYILDKIYEIMDLLGIDRSEVDTLTFKQVRQKLNQIYPPLSQSTLSTAEESLLRDRKKIFNTARYAIYTLSAIKGRENASWRYRVQSNINCYQRQ